jgi:hypothetical protein
MTAPKHTPGPWSYKTFETGGVLDDRIHSTSPQAGSGNVICLQPCDRFCPESAAKWEANAHLIAAAPGLYAKLKWLADWMRSVEGMSRNNLEELALDEADEIDALLAKARGEG